MLVNYNSIKLKGLNLVIPRNNEVAGDIETSSVRACVRACVRPAHFVRSISPKVYMLPSPNLVNMFTMIPRCAFWGFHPYMIFIFLVVAMETDLDWDYEKVILSEAYLSNYTC